MTRSSPPSAVGKRTRELQQSEQPYIDSSALHTVLEQPVTHDDVKARPRAGTMPSAFSSSRASVVQHHLGSTALNGSLLPPSLATTGSVSMPVSGATTPANEHLAPSNSELFPSRPIRASPPGGRLRSGSLNLPAPASTAAISTAFNTSVFSPQWNPAPPTSTPPTATAASPGGMKSPGGSIGDDSHVRTLDYLGLDGSGEVSPGIGSSSPWTPPVSLPAPVPMQRVGSAGGGPGPAQSKLLLEQVIRNRSNTIGVAPRPRNWSLTAPGPSITTSSGIASSPLAQQTVPSNGYFDESPDLAPSQDPGQLLYASVNDRTEASLSDSVRARAATISALEQTRDHLLNSSAGSGTRRRAGTIPVPGHSLSADSDANGSDGGLADPSSSSTLDYDLNNSLTSDHVKAASYDLASHLQTMAIGGQQAAESFDLPAPQQQPTRALWIGNLDPNTTAADIQAAFGVYGPIESLRLLHEKECAFINFVSIADAMGAKDDVLDRLGGRLAKGASMLRIGYAKVESHSPTGSIQRMPAPPAVSATTYTVIGGGDGMQTVPTRALWIGSIPPDINSNTLLSIFAPFGPIESARVLAHKQCGFVNFDKLQDSIAARNALHGKEILGPEVGPLKIGFAKAPPKAIVPLPADASEIPAGIPTKAPAGRPVIIPPGSELTGGVAYSVPNTSYQMSVAPSANIVPPPQPQQVHHHHHQQMQQMMMAMPPVPMPNQQQNPFGFPASGPESPTARIETFIPTLEDTQEMMKQLSGPDDPELQNHLEELAHRTRPHATEYYRSIPMNALNDPVLARRYAQHDAGRLKELKRKLEVEARQEDVDSIAHELLDECVPLSSDYIGNTVIQKLFERCSLNARLAMLERIAPHLAAIGTHKNGTWAAQKMIQCAQTEREYELISRALTPFTPPLLLNDFGNYVVQGTQRFGKHAEYIYDAIVDKVWEIGSGRFGARSTRQTLESPHTPKLHLKRVAVAIVSNAIPLASNANGALLITWFLETSNLPGRYWVLAPRFIPHLVSLCTNKLASVSILKMINQRADPAASRLLIDSIFSPDHRTLTDILSDTGHGTTCIVKILQSAFLSSSERTKLVERTKNELDQMRVTSNPAYRKILEEVGLSSPGLSASHSHSNSPSPSLSMSTSDRYGYQPYPIDYQTMATSPIPFAPMYYQQGTAAAASAYPYSPSPAFMPSSSPDPNARLAFSPPPPNPIAALNVNAGTHHPFNPSFTGQHHHRYYSQQHYQQ